MRWANWRRECFKDTAIQKHNELNNMTNNTKHPWFLSLQHLFSGVLILMASPSRGEDWPQAQGRSRDNKSAETGLLDAWPEGGPELAWTFRNCGVGYSGPAIVGGRVYIMGGRDGRAELMALDADSGKLLWSKPVNAKVFDFEGNSWGAGPRATPTVADGMIYALAGDGELVAIDTSGEPEWRVNMVSDSGGSVSIVDAGEPEI